MVNVSNEAELRAAIRDANAGGDSNITFTANITLTQSLPMITSDVTIEGSGFSINGANLYRAFFVQNGVVLIRNLTIEEVAAIGGDGGDAGMGHGAGGGGGLGAGAAIFVNNGANVTVENVEFGDAFARGGQGGRGGDVSGVFSAGGGGGGGMGGDGGSASAGGQHGGGGGGYAGAGGASVSVNGGGGGGGGEFGVGGQGNAGGGGGGGGAEGAGGAGSSVFQGGAGGGGGAGVSDAGQPGSSNAGGAGTNGGGAGGHANVDGADGGAFGGGGGGAWDQFVTPDGGAGGTGGGGGGAYGSGGAGGLGGGGGGSGRSFGGHTGGAGGFAGGGGGTGETTNAVGGAGGFGGGGGGAHAAISTASTGGAGGFGAGGGGGSAAGGISAGGFGGAGGTGAKAGGGGGAALGGAIFVATGGILTVKNPDFSGDYGVTGGAAGQAASAGVRGGAGQAQGEVIFLNADTTLELTADATISGDNAIAGTGDLLKAGAGTLTLAGDNANFTGEMQMNQGVLRVQSAGALGDTAAKTYITSGELSLENNIAINGEELFIHGTMRNISGANSWSGNIEFSAAVGSTFASDAGTLTISGAVSGISSFLNVTGAGATVISGVISDMDSFEKSGTGTLTLSGANTYGAETQVQAGVLRVTHAQALGTGVGGTTVSSGAALELSGGVAVAGEALTVGGLGVSNGGALRNVSGTNSWNGALTVSGATSITASAGSLTLSGAFNAGANGVHFGGAGDITVSGAIGGAGGEFTKSGAGVLTLSGVNTNAGDFDVLAGKLVVNGSIGSQISVSGGATLGGTGTVGDVTVTSGTLAAGNSAGILSTGDINLQAGSTLAVEIGGASAGTGGYDQIDVTGLVTLAGDLDVSFLGGFSPTSGTFTIINNDGLDAVSGTFDGLAEGATFDVGATRFTISYVGGVDSNDVVLTASAAPVIETPAPPTPRPPSMTPEEIRQAFTGSNGFNPGAAKTGQATITLPDGRVVENPNYKAAAALEQLIERFSAGLISDTYLADQVANLAGPTSAVALQAYQFFTGRTPGEPGMAWLVDSLDNANDLTDPYYAGFNTANRYINFAVNLGVQGEGRPAFEAGYGALDFTAAVRKAYDAIIGLDEAKAAGLDVDAAIAWIVSQKGYFDALGGSALGGKAAMVGYLMYAGFDADVGVYSDATHDWLVDAFNGEAVYGVDLVGRAGMSFADDMAA